MSIRKITHKGKEIVCIDWSARKSIVDALCLFEESAAFHRRSGKKLRTLDIFHGVSGNAPLLDRAEELGMNTFTDKREKSAAVGIGQLNRLMYRLFSQHKTERLAVFSTVEEALDYLAED
ncbi:MAG: hypothetical protein JXX14_11595 [Deltaproteobacteria bacterium]|nr:hypothetical protein [Deltaproteobacteria bacterium]